MRGWGRSIKVETNRGNMGPTSLTLSDMASFIEAQLDSPPTDIPVFVMGHSLGGQLIATMASTPKYKQLVSRLGGLILMAPYIRFNESYFTVGWKMRLATRWLRTLLPKYQTIFLISPALMVRDPEFLQGVLEDPNMNIIVTLETLGDALQRAENLDYDRLKLNDGIKAIYVHHGTDDRVCSYDAAKRWYDSQTQGVPDRTFKTYEGWCHAMQIDLPENQQTYNDDTAEWILAKT